MKLLWRAFSEPHLPRFNSWKVVCKNKNVLENWMYTENVNTICVTHLLNGYSLWSLSGVQPWRALTWITGCFDPKICSALRTSSPLGEIFRCLNLFINRWTSSKMWTSKTKDSKAKWLLGNVWFSGQTVDQAFLHLDGWFPRGLEQIGPSTGTEEGWRIISWKPQLVFGVWTLNNAQCGNNTSPGRS